MEFKCAKDDLYKAIQVVEKAVAIRSTLPIIGNILIETTKAGLKLSSNDLEIGIELIIDANIVQEGAILAPAKTLSNIVSKLPAGEVSFVVGNNNYIKISCGRSKFNIHGLPTEEFPMLHKIEKGTNFEIDADLLYEAIKQTVIAVSLDETKHVLNGVLMEIEKNQIKFVATDGFRLSQRLATLKGAIKEGANINCIIPLKALHEISRIIQQDDYKGVVKVVLSKEQISFAFKSVYLISRLIQGQFPDYKQVIPKEGKAKIIIARKDLLESTERASIIASANANIIKLEQADKNQLLISANTANIGNVAENVDVNIDGKLDFSIAFNVRLIMDVLKNIDEDNVVLTLNSQTTAGVIKPKENKDYTYVIMPIRTINS